MTIGYLSVLFSSLLGLAGHTCETVAYPQPQHTARYGADPGKMVLLKSAEARRRLDMICLRRQLQVPPGSEIVGVS
jgi:hypothetical protein